MEAALLEDAIAYADRWVEYRQRTRRVPGVQIAICHEDRILLSRTYGSADLETKVGLTAATIFRVASHSKMFTATAAMLLVERGALRLDDQAGQRLPWLPSGPGEIGRTTIRQLLSHSAGVIRDGGVVGFWQLERDFLDSGQLRELLIGTPQVFSANERFKYSNIGYSLLGMVIESAAGMPYPDFVRAAIVERLGLENTGPDLDGLDPGRLATGYSADAYGLPPLPLAHVGTGAMAAATGFYSTAEDLCRFGRSQFLGNPELLSDDSKREVQQELWSVEGTAVGYGLGFEISTVGGRRLVGHGGGFPGFITSTRIDPRERLVVVALTNSGAGPASELTGGIYRIINRALESPVSEDPASLDRFTGRFWSLGGASDFVRLGGQLLAISPELIDPTESMSELAQEGGDVLRIETASGFASAGERIRFRFDRSGMVERVDMPGAHLRPWEEYQRVRSTVEATRMGPRADPGTDPGANVTPSRV